MPILLGFTAAKKFGLPEYEGMIIGAALVYPYILGGSTYVHNTLFGIPVTMPSAGDYSSSLIPIICAVAFAAFFEKKVKKFIPDTIKLFCVPLVTCTVTYILTLLAIGPVASKIADGLSWFFNRVSGFSPILLGALVGGLWQVLVMFGLHMALVPMMLNDLATQGFSTALTGFFGCSFATTGAVFAIYLKTKNQKTKSIALPAFVSGIAGVTESAIYGITLPKKQPFIITCIVGAITGAGLMACGVASYVSAGMGVFGYPAELGGKGFKAHCKTGDKVKMGDLLLEFDIDFIQSQGLSTITPVIVTNTDDYPSIKIHPGVVSLGDRILTLRETAETSENLNTETVSAPITGEVRPLDECQDELFASGQMGQGFVLEPSEGKVYAPCDGAIKDLFQTLHALGITSDGGAELLLHIGMDTVDLHAMGFKAHCKTGDQVKKGDLLIEFDIPFIKSKNLPVTTPVIVTNGDQYSLMMLKKMGVVKHGEEVLDLKA